MSVIPGADTYSRGMSDSTALAWSFLLGLGATGYALYELYHMTFKNEKDIHIVSGWYGSYAIRVARVAERIDTLETMDEVELGKNQAWQGLWTEDDFTLSITIWRQKDSTVRKNEEWMEWNGEEDASCTVRDFYLGNSTPDFLWSVEESETEAVGRVSETLINGWDSVIQVRIRSVGPSKTTIEEKFGSFNGLLKHAIASKSIEWSRQILHSEECLETSTQ